MTDEISIPKKSQLDYLIEQGGIVVPAEVARRDFKRHMDKVGPIAEYYKQKERDGLVQSRQIAVGG